jgi:chemotaxis protein MotA
MKTIVGLLIVIACVLGGYLLSHGKLEALFQPFELLIIGGAALGAFVITNPWHLIRKVGAELLGIFRSPAHDRAATIELLSFLYDLANIARKDGMLKLESHIDEPGDSELFQRYPGVAKSTTTMEFLSDHVRLILTGAIDGHYLEDILEAASEAHHADSRAAGDALNKVADALPGFGIVAAVMGVVITMGSLDQPPQILGDHIAAALVGTFIGILLAYGFVGPMASAMHHNADEQGVALLPIKAALLAMVANYPPMVVVELARKSLPVHLRPGFAELEAQLRSGNQNAGVKNEKPQETQEAA